MLPEKDKYEGTLALLNNLPGMVYRCVVEQCNYKYIFVSDGCFALTGYTAEELTSSSVGSFRETIHPDDEGWINEQIEETVNMTAI